MSPNRSEYDAVPLAIVGCGGMGRRHLFGLKELYDSGRSNVRLVAACDLRRENAEHLAQEAKELLGDKPLVFQDMGEMASALPDLQAVDVVTDAGSHHVVVPMALELGFHVLCEKPLALTMRGCNRVIEAERRHDKVLSVAENYRRDPMSRLTKELVRVGVIGTPFVLFEISAGSGDTIVILPWRHYKDRGGILTDAGVHTADLMLYYMGDVRQVYARTQLWEATRYKPTKSTVSDFYAPWYDEMPASIEATVEDTFVSVLQFENGAIGQWTQFYAAHGEGFGHRVIYGSEGSLRPGGTRNGQSPLLTLDGESTITKEALLDFVPDYCLDELSAILFGDDRPTYYDFTFPEADRKLLALEYHEFGECVLTGKKPEVDSLTGRRALAVCYAGLESGVLDRPVTVEEVEDEEVDAYQEEINTAWGI
ncbi:MAG: Gfo/Idh/MocA family oxidoreductase [Chloroflexota bacterium]|nr:Gfo/Idh/MocA family oxidoreductase [Chloroflexota bacterium]